MVDVAVVNFSDLDDSEVSQMISAVQKQLDEIGPVWGFEMMLQQYVNRDVPPPTMQWVLFLPDAEHAEMLGVHDLTPAGLPLGKVFVNTTHAYQQQISRVFSHECCEMAVDPMMTKMVTVGNRTYLVEVGDPFSLDTQGTDIDGVLVSNIAYPAYYGFEAKNGETAFDWLGNMPGPIPTMIDGSYLMFQEGGIWQHTQQFGMAKVPHGQTASRYMANISPGSRRDRRMRTSGQWVRSTIEQNLVEAHDVLQESGEA